MKKIFAVLALCFSAYASLADCAGSGLNVYPEGKYIKQNPVFIIQGYANDQELIRQLNKKYSVYLQSGSKKINLEVKEVLEGQFYITQALVAPVEKLEAGSEYTLHIVSLSDKKEEVLNRWNNKTQEHEDVQWTVEKGMDTQAPTWTKKPKEAKKELAHYGCGPAEWVIFGCATSETNIMVKANVTSSKTKKTVSCYVFLDKENAFAIGHGMCSGAFTFKEQDYEITFDLLDFSGNRTAWTGDKIHFTRPTNVDSK